MAYLFFTGDPNLRHSTQIMGELGWLDILALGCFLFAGLFAVARAFRPQPGAASAPPSRAWSVAACAILAGAFATLPAALCWEGLPHALRSMGGWPAVAVFTGSVLSVAWRRWPLGSRRRYRARARADRAFRPLLLLGVSEEIVRAWDANLREAADRRDPAYFAAVAHGYPALGYRYY